MTRRDLTPEEVEVRARSLPRAEDVEDLRQNILSAKRPDLAAIVEAIGKERFPPKVGGGGATPTTAVFRGKERSFRTAKDAYLWLVEQLSEYRPGLIQVEDERFRAFFRTLPKKYFAPKPSQLFPPDSKLRDNSSTYATLQNGWYAYVHLDNADKFAILLRLSELCALTYPTDWDFKVDGATLSLAVKQRAAAELQASLREAGW